MNAAVITPSTIGRRDELVYYNNKDVVWAGISEIAWLVKVGRNDPWPCGSGLKYKHWVRPR